MNTKYIYEHGFNLYLIRYYVNHEQDDELINPVQYMHLLADDLDDAIECFKEYIKKYYSNDIEICSIDRKYNNILIYKEINLKD